MKKNFLKTACGLTILGLVITFCGNGSIFANQAAVEKARQQAAQTEQKIKNLQSKSASINKDINSTKGYVQELDSMVENLSSQISAYDEQIDVKQREIDAKNAEISQKQQEIEKAQKELEEKQDQEKRGYDAMKKRIQYMYECADASFLDLIFSSSNLSELLGRSEYINSITEYDRKQLKALRDTQEAITLMLSELNSEKEKLNSEKSELLASKIELEKLNNELSQQHKYVETVLNTKTQFLTSLEQDKGNTEYLIAVAQAEYAEQKAEADRLQREWEEEKRRLAAEGKNADAEAAKKLQEIGLAGGFRWPIPGYNKIVSKFGPRNLIVSGVDVSNHSGVDISGDRILGKPVYAMYDGVVTMTDVYRGKPADQPSGNKLQINHGAGVITSYHHLSGFAVSVGQNVKAGDLIGYVGSTGASTGPHLHLSIYIKGELVDPLIYVAVPVY